MWFGSILIFMQTNFNLLHADADIRKAIVYTYTTNIYLDGKINYMALIVYKYIYCILLHAAFYVGIATNGNQLNYIY